MSFNSWRRAAENAPYSGTVKAFKQNAGLLFGYAASAPTEAVWAPGAIVNVAGTPYYNTGTKASPSWTNLAAAASGGAFTVITVSSTADVTGAATFGSTVDITGETTITGLLNADGGIAVDTSNFTVSGSTGAVVSASTVTATGLSGTASTTFAIAGSATGNPKLTLDAGPSGSGQIEIGLLSTGNITIGDGDVTLTTLGADTVAITQAATVGTTLGVTGDFTVGSSKMVVTATTGATVIGNITGLAGQHMTITSGATDKNMTINANGTGTMNIADVSTGAVSIGTASTGTITIGKSGGGALTMYGTTATITGSTAIALTGNTTVTGDLAVTGTITGTYTFSSLSASTITLTGTTDTGNGIYLNGDSVTTGNILYIHADASLTSGYFINCVDVATSKFKVAEDGTVTIAGTATGTDALVINAGDILITAGAFDMTVGDATLADGSLTITDADNAGSFSVTNNTATTATIATIAGSGVLATTGTGLYLNFANLSSGKALSINVPAMAADGTALYIAATEGTIDTGKYIVCYDAAANDFSVGKYGATVIAGNAATDVLTVTAGDIQITSGDIDLDSGFVAIDTAADEGNSIKRNWSGAGAAAVLTVEDTHTGSLGCALTVNQLGTGESTAVLINHDGTGDALTITSKAAADSAIKVTTEAATGTVLEGICAANTTVPMISLDGTTGDWLGAATTGLIHVTCDGALAQTTSSLVRLAYSGAPAQANSLGTCLHVADTGSVDTASAVYINSATGTAFAISAAAVVDCVTISSAAAAASAIKITTTAATGTTLESVFLADTTVPVISLSPASGGWIGAANKGLIDIVGAGATLADVAASVIRITTPRAKQDPTKGVAIDIADVADAPAVSGTAYMIHITSTNNSAIWVESGACLFAPNVSFTTGITFSTSGLVVTQGAANTYFDAGTAEETIDIGNTTSTDLILHGSGAAGEDCTWDASASALEFSAGAALVLPQGTSSGGTGRQVVTGSIFYETDQKKLWVYDGAGWVGVQLA